MLDKKYLVSKLATNKFYNVSEATDILSKYGISHNEKKTRDLIAKNKLKARGKGTNPNDRRSGYEVSEKAIYDLIIEEIPIMKDMLEQLIGKASAKKRANSTKKEENTEK